MKARTYRRDTPPESLELASEAKEWLLMMLQSDGWQRVAVPALRARASQLRSYLCSERLTLEEIRVLQGRHSEIERLLTDPMKVLSGFKEGDF